MTEDCLSSPPNEISDSLMHNTFSNKKLPFDKLKPDKMESSRNTIKPNNGILLNGSSGSKNHISKEIGHVPGQKWPHVIIKQNSLKQMHIQVGYNFVKLYHVGILL